MRTIMTATHTKEELQQALEVLGAWGRGWEYSDEYASWEARPCGPLCPLW
jgi:hypothetical protein